MKALDHLLATGSFKPQGKDIYGAIAAGLVLGPLGLGLYLRSWRVFFVTFLLVLTVTLLTGSNYIVNALLAGVWGGMAVHRAQKRALGFEGGANERPTGRIDLGGSGSGASGPSKPEPESLWPGEPIAPRTILG